MKKKISLPVLCPSLFVAMFCLLTTVACFGQDCKTQAAVKPSTLVRFPDIYVGAVSDDKKPASWNITKMKPQLAKTESWIKNIGVPATRWSCAPG